MTARPADAATIDPTIVGDIRRAARATNMDFGYLMAQAAQESGFHPDAKASTSNATGLYQFMDGTWLREVKEHGAKYGLGAFAAAITYDHAGNPQVTDPQLRQQILDLRKDPAASADLAAELARDNKAQVEQALGRPASATDLYLAHFLGAQGATSFVKTIEHDSATKAADLMPQAAAANHSVFYAADGTPKSVAEIYRNFASRIEGASSDFAGRTGMPGEDSAGMIAMGSPFPGEPTDGTDRASQPLLAMMNVIAFAAVKLLGRTEEDADPAPKPHDPYRQTNTSA
jgi:hypothetical protein